MIRFCPNCGGGLVERIPELDTRRRLVCDACGHIVYQNPKVVVGAIIEHEDRIVLVRRGIEPRRGFWGLPAGYLELGETVEAGATREAHEETGYHITISRLLNIYTRIEAGIVNVFYLARITGGDARLSDETLDVTLFSPDAIPWDDLAFETHRLAIQEWLDARASIAP